MDENRITYFAETDARNKRSKFGIKAKDRTRHVYVIGKTGMGKSTLLENMAVQDIQSGEGMVFIDPHGKTADLLMEYVPKERIRDVIYIAPFDTEYPISFNVLESVDVHKRHLVVAGLMSTFKKIWEDAWSARMEYILTNTLLALLEAPGSTLLGVNRMLSDKEYRKSIVEHVKDPSVKSFWVKEFANYTERMAAEAVPAIQNKVGQFTANPLIRNMIGQPHSSFDFRTAMDNRKILIINLSKGRIGDDNMKLLGGLLVTKIYLAAMSRADVPDRVAKMLPNFYLYVDEFQNFANASFADILSEARKYKLNLTIAHQYIDQMDEDVGAAVFGNVGTMIAFRVGATDAEALEKEFAPEFTIEDLVNLGFAQIYLKLMIDGLSSSPFSAVTLPPIPHPDISYVKEIIASSREQFAKPQAEVEAEIIKFHEAVITTKKDSKPKDDSKSAVKSEAKPDQGGAKAPQSAPSPLGEKLAAVQAEQKLSSSAVEPKNVEPVPASTQKMAENPAATKKPTFAELVKAAQDAAHGEVRNKSVALPHKPSPADKAAPVLSGKPPESVDPQVGSRSKLQEQSQPKSSDQSQPQASPQPEIKPVPLSALTKQPVKSDPKVPTPKNVNDLKNALAAVLAKNKPVPKETDKPPIDSANTSKAVKSENIETKAPDLDTAKASGKKSSESKSASTKDAATSIPESAQEKKEKESTWKPSDPKEVPEEILNNILK